MQKVRDWLLERNIDPKVALDAGVLYDRNRDALLYPRTKLNGQPAGYKVRHLLGSRVYNDVSGISVNECLPWSVRQGTGALAICEGETDALALASNLVFFEPELEDAEVVAVPGSSVFPNEWASLFKDRDTIYLFPDPDTAGEQMVNKVCGLMARSKVVRLDPKYGDLSDHIKQAVFELQDMIKAAKPVPVQTKLRRTGYKFKRTHDLPNHILVDVVSRDTRLKRRGKEYYGVCPLHKDKDPSFSVDPAKGVFYCYGCKNGGDIIAYLQKKEGLSFRDALSRAKSLR